MLGLFMVPGLDEKRIGILSKWSVWCCFEITVMGFKFERENEDQSRITLNPQKAVA